MTIAFAVGVTTIGVAAAVVHSAIGERRIFGPLCASNQGGVLKSRATLAIVRAVWHIPSLTWAVLGVAVLVGRLHGGNPLLSAAAGAVFAGSGVANLVALRRPHPSGLVVLSAGALSLADAAL